MKRVLQAIQEVLQDRRFKTNNDYLLMIDRALMVAEMEHKNIDMNKFLDVCLEERDLMGSYNTTKYKLCADCGKIILIGDSYETFDGEGEHRVVCASCTYGTGLTYRSWCKECDEWMDVNRHGDCEHCAEIEEEEEEED